MGQVETVKAPSVPGWEQYYKEAKSYWAGDINSGPQTAEGFYGWTGIGSSGTENYYQFGALVRNTEYQGIKTNVGTDDVIRITIAFRGDGTSTPFRFFKLARKEQTQIDIIGNLGGMHNPFGGLKDNYVNVRSYPGETTVFTSSHASIKALAYDTVIDVGGEEIPWLEATKEQRGVTYLEEISSNGVYVQGIYPFDVWYTGSDYVVSFAILLEDFSL